MSQKFYLLFLPFIFFITQSKAASSLRSDTIDIRKTIIVFDITDFTTKNIFAKTTLDIQSKKNNVTQLLFDLEGLTVDSVFINSSNTTFSHIGQTLTINSNPLNINDTALIDIYYHGIPLTDPTWGGFSYVGNYGFQMGVGFGANPHSFGRTWHPCFDNFVERSLYEFYITTTNDKMAVCNGILLDSTTNTNSTKTWHWKLAENIPSYLAAVAVCNYIFVTKNLVGNNGNIDALIACEAIDSNKVNASFAHLQQSFSMLEEKFGTYSWEKVGYSLVPFNYGAMEHATNIHIGKPFIDGTLQYETMIAHELSHHWFGDLITCSTAQDMWLNEGFASYCEYLHQGYTYGDSAYNKYMKDNHFYVLSKAHINDNGYRAVANMDSNYTYGTTVYSKGADMLHTLKTYMGDSLFFNGLTSFVNSHKFQSVSTNDLNTYLSNYASINLSDYFSRWIFEKGFTHFSIDSTQFVNTGSSFETSVFLRQRKHQSINYYNNVPLEIGFYDAQMQLHIYSLNFVGRCMQFNVSLPFEPVMIVVDPLSKISDAITEEEKMVKQTGTTNFTQAKCVVFSKALQNANDSSFIRIEHSWIAPDRFKNQANANGFVLCDSRFWKVDGINLSNLQGLLRFDYNASSTNYFLDSTWIQNSEDSIRLFYRKDATQEWTFANDSLKAGSLTDRIGNVFVKEIKAGEYCFGIKRSNYIDTVQTDAPIGGCAIATTVNNFSTKKVNEITIYPNPTSQDVVIEFPTNLDKKILLEIFDIAGKKIFSKNEIATNIIKINLSTLKEGIYFIKLLTDKKSYSSKIIIEK